MILGRAASGSKREFSASVLVGGSGYRAVHGDGFMETVRSSDQTVIAFDRYGAGPAVVLIGGAFQHRRLDRQTARLAQLLAAAGFSALHYDRRGRGDSGDTPPYAVDRELEDIDAVMSAAGGSAFLYGMSSGSVLALRAAATGRPVARV